MIPPYGIWRNAKVNILRLFYRTVRVPKPGSYFISHAYHDQHAVEHLKRTLPFYMKPYIFSKIPKVAPKQLVSSELIKAIHQCTGLIYLKGGQSARSFWVAFERDYGLRARKPVYSFDPASGKIERDETSPLHLRAHFSYAKPADSAKVNEIVNFMCSERFFSDWTDDKTLDSAGITFEAMLEKTVQRRIAEGSYMVMFWSANLAAARWLEDELKLIQRLDADRLLLVLLDATPPPNLGRDDPGRLLEVQLYGDAERSFINRIDDLIVHLYWLIYKNTQHNQFT
jgi:hypothetical protein